MILHLFTPKRNCDKDLNAIQSDVLIRFGADDCVGDFNLDTLSSSNHEINSVNDLLSHSFVPFLNVPTKGTACMEQ